VTGDGQVLECQAYAEVMMSRRSRVTAGVEVVANRRLSPERRRPVVNMSGARAVAKCECSAIAQTAPATALLDLRRKM